MPICNCLFELFAENSRLFAVQKNRFSFESVRRILFEPWNICINGRAVFVLFFCTCSTDKSPLVAR